MVRREGPPEAERLVKAGSGELESGHDWGLEKKKGRIEGSNRRLKRLPSTLHGARRAENAGGRRAMANG